MAKRQLSAGDRCLWIHRKIHRSSPYVFAVSHICGAQEKAKEIQEQLNPKLKEAREHEKYLGSETFLFFKEAEKTIIAFTRKPTHRKRCFPLSLVVAA